MIRSLKRPLRVLLAIAMVAVGVMHFVHPDDFAKIVPRALPSPLTLVYVSGFFEIAGGIGLLVPRVRRLASFGLVALYVAVFPANINMAVNHIEVGGREIPEWALWLRLPFQLVVIAWALWVGRNDD